MNKYRNKKVVIDGITFDSQREGDRYLELVLMWRGGYITGLIVHEKFELIPKNDKFPAVTYTDDFSYTMINNGRRVVEDVKGMKRGSAYSMFKLKQKLMYHVHGIEVIEV